MRPESQSSVIRRRDSRAVRITDVRIMRSRNGRVNYEIYARLKRSLAVTSEQVIRGKEQKTCNTY